MTDLDTDIMEMLIDRSPLQLWQIEVDRIDDGRTLFEEAIRAEMLFRGLDVFEVGRAERTMRIGREDLGM